METEEIRKHLEYFQDLGFDQIYKRQTAPLPFEPKGEIILPSMAPVNDSAHYDLCRHR